MSCPDIVELEQYVMRGLDDAAQAVVQEHLERCMQCAGDVLEMSENLQLAPALRRNREVRPDEAPEQPPETVGPYRIVRKIGQGGMGAVYEAEQENPRRKVALKMIRPGLVSPSLLRRFKHEAQVLGRLRHPGIAQIYEAGTHAANGHRQPFFAMELVQGQTLLRYALEKELSTRERLELIAKVCDAVHHAHQRGVIHRDLKPDNILVDETGGTAQPKILDFGVSRIVDPDSKTTTLHTSVGQIVGTIAYMSPEQAGADPVDTDTRADVYALGVVCYELLCGRLPYRLSAASVAESVRAIAQDDPTPLATVDRSLRGDVSTIVGKALEKDKSRRYQSAAEMAADVRRHLRDEPINAHPPSAIYQLRKFARRNKGLVTGIVLAFTLLILGVIGTSIGMVRARSSAALARNEADKAKAINQFLDRMLASANPNRATQDNALAGRDVKVVQLLDDAGKQLDAGELNAQPAVEAAVRRTLASTYSALADYSSAEKHIRASLQMHRSLHGDIHPDVATDLNGLGVVLHSQGRFAEARQAYSDALETRRKLSSVMSEELAESINNYAAVLKDMGSPAEAEQLLLQALDARRKLRGEDHPEVAATLNQLAVAQHNQGHSADAEQSLRKALAMRIRIFGEQHAAVANTKNALATILLMDRRPADAEPFFRDALQRRTELFGEDHPEVAESRIGLAVVLREQKKFAEAEVMLRQSLESQRKLLGNDNHDVANTLGNLGAILRDQNKLDKSEEAYREALAILRKVHGNEHESVALAVSNLGSLILSRSRPAEAEPLLREAISIYSQHPDPAAAASRALSQTYLGASLVELKRYEEAERVLLEAIKFLSANSDPGDRRVRLTHSHLAKLYEAWDQPQRAAEYRALLPATQPTTQPTTQPATLPATGKSS